MTYAPAVRQQGIQRCLQTAIITWIPIVICPFPPAFFTRSPLPKPSTPEAGLLDINNAATPSRSRAASPTASEDDIEEAEPMPEGSSIDNNIPDWYVSQSPSPIPEIIDPYLTFAEEFSILSDLSDASPAINSLNSQPVNVDRSELVISSDGYQRRFKDTLATVQLRSRAPLRRTHTTFHRGPNFDRWLLLAPSETQALGWYKVKDPFFAQLDQYKNRSARSTSTPSQSRQCSPLDFSVHPVLA
jgi:hypothetical protein